MFGSNITDLPRLYNFAMAVDLFNRTKGIRGRTHVKPLKSTRRSPDEYKITASKDSDGKILAVSCWLYETAVLVYYPDELVINTYNSRTTNEFIYRIGPHWIAARQFDNSQLVAIGGEGLFVGNGARIEIPVDENYQPIKGQVCAPKLNKITLNKSRAAAARKLCKGVVDLMEVTSKLDGYWQALLESTEPCDDPDMIWLRGVLKNGWYHARPTWDNKTIHNFGHGYPRYNVAELLPRVKKFLYERQYVAYQCYDKTPAPYGVVPNEWEIAE